MSTKIRRSSLFLSVALILAGVAEAPRADDRPGLRTRRDTFTVKYLVEHASDPGFPASLAEGFTSNPARPGTPAPVPAR